MVIVVGVVMGRGHFSHREGSLKVITEREKEREKGRRERGRERGEKERENKVMMNVSLKFKSANIVYFRLVLCIDL